MRKNLGLKEKISFKTVSMTSEELLYSTLSGYTFCGVFDNFPANNSSKTYVKTDGYFTLSGKSADFFTGSYCIGVDIDETNYASAQEFISKLKFPPTFWYTSLNNKQIDASTGKSKGARFRLIYTFYEKIRNKYFFRYCSQKVHQMVETSTEETIHDKCGLQCTQYFNGSNIFDKTLTVDYDISDVIYSFSDFNINTEEFIYYLNDNCKLESPTKSQKDEIKQLKCSILSQNIKEKLTTRETVILSDSDTIERLDKEPISISLCLIRDATNLEWSVFYNKYKHHYEYVFRVERDEWCSITDSTGNLIQFQYCDEDYLELKWIPIRLVDGKHRKRTLYHRGWLRRIIKPTITPNELFYNLLVDRERFFDNTDDELNIYRLQSIVQDCFAGDIESIKNQNEHIYNDTIDRCRKKQVIIHRTSKSKIRANSLLREIRWRFLDEAYNKNLTVTDNLQILNDSDFIISRSTLYKYCQSRGILTKTKSEDRYIQFASLHQEGLSYRDEQKYLDGKRLHLSLGSLKSYRMRYEKETKNIYHI